MKNLRVISVSLFLILIGSLTIATFAVNKERIASLAHTTNKWTRTYSFDAGKVTDSDMEKFDACWDESADGETSVYCSKPEDPYSNNNIQWWAHETVLEYGKTHDIEGFGPKDVWGVYDLCNQLSDTVKTDGWIYSKAPKRLITSPDSENSYPIGLALEYPADLINACTIVLNGAEW